MCTHLCTANTNFCAMLVMVVIAKYGGYYSSRIAFVGTRHLLPSLEITNFCTIRTTCPCAIAEFAAYFAVYGRNFKNAVQEIEEMTKLANRLTPPPILWGTLAAAALFYPCRQLQQRRTDKCENFFSFLILFFIFICCISADAAAFPPSGTL